MTKKQQKPAQESLFSNPAFKHSPIIQIIVDSHRQVVDANDAAVIFSTNFGRRILNIKGGEYFGCLGSLESKKGCGFGRSCSKCRIRRSVIYSLKTNKSVHRREAELSVNKNGKITFHVLVSTTPIKLNGRKGKFILVSVEDITALKQMNEVFNARNEAIHKVVDNIRDGMIIVKNKPGFPVTYSNIMAKNLAYPGKISDNAPKLIQFEPFYSAAKMNENMTGASKGEVQVSRDIEFGKGKNGVSVYSVFYMPVMEAAGKTDEILIIIRDSTYDKRLRDKISEEKKVIETYIDFMNSLVVVLDKKGTILSMNSTALKITGYRKNEALGKNWFELMIPPDERAVIMKLHKDDMTGKSKKWVYQNKIILKNGERRLIRWSNSIIKDEKGMPVSSVSSGIDITAETLAQSLVIENEKKYKALFDGSNDAVYLIDFSVPGKLGRFIDVNEVALERLGYTRQEFLAMDVRGINFNKNRERLKKLGIMLLKKGEAIFETQHVTKSGEVLHVEINARVMDISGKKVILAASRDLTERNLSIKKISESEQKYRLLFSKMTDALALHEIITDKSGRAVDYRFIEMNSAFEKMLGLKREDVINKLVTQVVPTLKQDKTDWIKEYGEVALKGKEKRIIQYSVEFKKWFSVLAYCPSPGFFVTIFQDITAVKMAQENVEASEKKFKALFESAPTPYFLYDEKGVFVDGNKAAEQLTGYDRSEVIGKSMFSINLLSKADMTKAAVELAKKVAGSRNSKPMEFTIRRKDGSEVVLEILTTPIKIDGLKRILGAAVDVTERRQISFHFQELSLCGKLRAEIWDRASEKKADESSAIEMFLKLIGTRLKLRKSMYFRKNSEFYECAVEWNSVVELQHTLGLKIPADVFEGVSDKNTEPEILTFKEIITKKSAAFNDSALLIFKRLMKQFGNNRFFMMPLRHGGIVEGFCIFSLNQDSTWSPERKHFLTDAMHIITKIIEQKRLEKTVFDSEQRYRTVADFTYDWEYWSDEKEGYYYISPSVERITGYKKEDFTENRVSFKSIIHPDSMINWERHLSETQENDAPLQIDLKINCKNGENKWISHVCRPVTGVAGLPVGRRASNRDITDRKSMEQEVINSEKHFRSLIEQSSDIVALLNENGVFMYISNAVERVLGYEANEVLGYEIYNFVDEKWNQLARGIFEEMFRSPGSVVRREIKFIKKSGEEVFLDVSAKNLLKEVAVQGIIINALDVTERKNTNENLKRIIWQLEQSNSELEQFAYVASHDLKEPLRMISNYLDLIQMRQGKDFSRETTEFMTYAMNGTSRMYDLIQALLAYSKIGRKADPKNDVNLNLVIDGFLNDFSEQLKGGEITVKPLPIVYAHQVEMTQLFYNLIGNAVKFRAQNRPPMITVSAREHGEEWIFTVEDNGIGMEKQYQEKVFKLFERLHGDAEYQGTGIGLTLCRKIVQTLGGRIWIESEKNKGTKVIFILPKRRV